MEILCDKYLPFQYKMYKKQLTLPLSDKVITKFIKFLDYIVQTKEKLPPMKILTAMYMDISNDVVKEIRKAGNSKSIHTSEEIQFLFISSYLLIDKYKLTQEKLAPIFNMNKNNFSKLDIYPQRCHDAYCYLNEGRKSSLIPYQKNAIGIQIAEYINKEVQAVHCCMAFIGITNDLDVFANVSSTDKKAYVLTSPLFFDEDDLKSKEKANYAYARYLFALGNHLYDDNGKLVSAGDIKNKVKSLLHVQDNTWDEKDGVLPEILAGDDVLKDYMLDINKYSYFQELRAKYKHAQEKIHLVKRYIRDEVDLRGIGYEDECLGAKEISADDLEKLLNESNPPNMTDEEFVEQCVKDSEKIVENIEPQLLEYLNIRKLLGMNKDNLCINAWIQFISQSVRETFILRVNEECMDTVKDLQPLFINKVKAAACFWISETFKNINVDDDYLKKICSYLESSCFLTYIDRLNAPPSGNKSKVSQEDGKNRHIYMWDVEADISEMLKTLPLGIENKVERPVLVYVDTEAHRLDYEDIKKMVCNKKAIVVVHDAYGLLKDSEQKPINEELHLYVFFEEEEV